DAVVYLKRDTQNFAGFQVPHRDLLLPFIPTIWAPLKNGELAISEDAIPLRAEGIGNLGKKHFERRGNRFPRCWVPDLQPVTSVVCDESPAAKSEVNREDGRGKKQKPAGTRALPQNRVDARPMHGLSGLVGMVLLERFHETHERAAQVAIFHEPGAVAYVLLSQQASHLRGAALNVRAGLALIIRAPLRRVVGVGD